MFLGIHRRHRDAKVNVTKKLALFGPLFCKMVLKYDLLMSFTNAFAFACPGKCRRVKFKTLTRWLNVEDVLSGSLIFKQYCTSITQSNQELNKGLTYTSVMKENLSK